jgi:hypothetical protein
VYISTLQIQVSDPLVVHLIYLVTSLFRSTSKASAAASNALTTTHQISDSLQPERSIKLFFGFRVAVFILWTLLMLAASIYQAFDGTTTNPHSDILFSWVAPVAFFCFATQVSGAACAVWSTDGAVKTTDDTQHDILRVWHVPTNMYEWKQLLRLVPAESGRPKKSASPVEGELDWAEFLGTVSAQTPNDSGGVWWDDPQSHLEYQGKEVGREISLDEVRHKDTSQALGPIEVLV